MVELGARTTREGSGRNWEFRRVPQVPYQLSISALRIAGDITVRQVRQQIPRPKTKTQSQPATSNRTEASNAIGSLQGSAGGAVPLRRAQAEGARPYRNTGVSRVCGFDMKMKASNQGSGDPRDTSVNSEYWFTTAATFGCYC